jgi:hypothetical protein
MDDMREVVKAIQDLKQALGASNQGSGLNTLISELVKAVNAQTVAVKAQTAQIALSFPQWQPVPPLFNSPGVAGQVAYEAGFYYVAVASNHWQRVAIADF